MPNAVSTSIQDRLLILERMAEEGKKERKKKEEEKKAGSAGRHTRLLHRVGKDENKLVSGDHRVGPGTGVAEGWVAVPSDQDAGIKAGMHTRQTKTEELRWIYPSGWRAWARDDVHGGCAIAGQVLRGRAKNGYSLG